MQTVTSKDGTPIAFDKVGSGPAVILVNGAIAYRAFDPSMPQLAELLGKHFTVYNYDRRGRGDSGDTQPFAKELEMEDLQALVEAAFGKAMSMTAATPGSTMNFLQLGGEYRVSGKIGERAVDFTARGAAETFR